MSEMTPATEAAPHAAPEAETAPGVCRLLRTKTAFGTFRGNAYAWHTGRSTTAVYWCLRTMETAGPDDNYTHPHTCRPGRSCFEENAEG